MATPRTIGEPFMNDNPKPAALYRYLVAAACVIVIVAGMRAARSLLVPFLLAAFFAVVLTPILRWLERKRVPTAIALVVILAGLTLLGSGVVLMVGKSFNDFSNKLPEYQVTLGEQSREWTEWLRDRGFEIPAMETAAPSGSSAGGEGPAEAGQAAAGDAPSQPGNPFDVEWLLGIIRSMLSGLSNLFSIAIVVFITLIFMLLEASRWPAKVRAAMARSGSSFERIGVIVTNVRRYVAIKTATSALTGTLVVALLLVLGIDYAMLWGLVAFLLNFVPNIGSIMAAVPAVALSLVQAGVPHAIGVAAGYVAINGFISYAVEPRYMGKGLGLSTLVVFLSLVFWGWVLGPVGMLLSAPLTMIAKIMLEDYDDTRWIAILLSGKPPEKGDAGEGRRVKGEG